MAELQRIQNCMDKLSSLIQELEAMQESADAETIKNELLIWKSETDSILEQEIDDYTREVEDFNRRWRMPMVGNTIKSAVIRKLRDAHTDIRLIIKAEEPVKRPAVMPELPDYAITDYAKQLYGL